MNTDIQQQKKWGVAFVREAPLPPYQTWRLVPYYTCLINVDKTKYYIGKREDRSIDIEAIQSYPVFSIPVPEVIQKDEAVFLDWEGNYFIGKKDSLELPRNRNIIHSNSDTTLLLFATIMQKINNEINEKYKFSAEPLYDNQYQRTAS